jgi:EpsI family protein
MKPLQVSAVLACLMACASIAGTAARPSEKPASSAPRYILDKMVPARFGPWQALPSPAATIVNPQTEQLLNKLYSQVLTRTYMNRDGYRVMLSLAYGNDQRGALQAHKPEVCYPAQGFKLHDSQDARLDTPYGSIATRQLSTSLGPRQEPVTYWFTMGDTAVRSKLEQRLVEVRYGLTGQIPDGLLFRVSSIDGQPVQAYGRHRDFVVDLLAALSPEDRTRLSGLTPLTAQ